MKPIKAQQATEPFDRFKELTRKLLSVPKKELDEKIAVYKEKKAVYKQKKED